MPDTQTPETAAATPATSPAPDPVEFDYEDSPETPDPDPTPPDQDPDQDPDPSEDPRDAALAELRRELATLRGEMTRITPTKPTTTVPDQPPKPVDQLQTAQDIAEYMDWRRARDRDEALTQARLEAAAVSSELRVRGLFSRENLGPSLSYDSLVDAYIRPLERKNPATEQLFMSQNDPAMARYLMAYVLRATEKLGNDPVKVIRELERALTSRTRNNEELLTKIDQAARSQADQVNLKPSKPKRPAGKITAKDLKDMSLGEYARRKKEWGISPGTF